jgi:thymidylate kinase
MQASVTNIDKPPTAIAGVVAVIGCDGTGKTCLTADLLLHLRGEGPAELHYMGTVSGETGDKIKRLPFIGSRFEEYLAAKARRAQDTRKKLPGTATALVMYLFSLRRVFHFRRILALARRGVVVITDRFPQAEIPGFHYDGPGLSAPGGNNWLVRKLAAHELKLYRWMAGYPPALVIRLNIDVDTALARKPDHKPAELRDKIAVAPKLHFNGARIVDIDARAPYPQVLAEALRAVSTHLAPPRATRHVMNAHRKLA